MYMKILANKKCIPCQGNEPPLSSTEASQLLSQLLSNWTIIENKKLHKQFTFDSFTSAIEFVNKVAKIAEEEDHHPDITINYKKVTIELTTHAIDGLSENDFIMAAKIEGKK